MVRFWVVLALVVSVFSVGLDPYVDAAPPTVAQMQAMRARAAAIRQAPIRQAQTPIRTVRSNNLYRQNANKLVKSQASVNPKSSANAFRYKEHQKQAQDYGKAGVRELQNGKIRYYGKIDPAKTKGEMAGSRQVREWNPVNNQKKSWRETVDHTGKVRIVRPQARDNTKIH